MGAIKGEKNYSNSGLPQVLPLLLIYERADGVVPPHSKGFLSLLIAP
jgi:hypothetical protein